MTPTRSISGALLRGTEALSASSDSARADAQLLLAHTIERNRAWLLAHGDDPLDAPGVERFEAFVARRCAGEPIAYILGSAWFCGREFVVNPAVLVPRPESEHLVEEAAAHLRRFEAGAALDIGTGSGAIGCSIAADVPGARVVATDISPEALSVARHNAGRLGVSSRCTFLLGDLAEPVRTRTYDAIVANLPYVPARDIAAAPDPVSFEPRLALDGGPDGLDAYRRLLPALPAMLRPGGLALFEAAPPTIDGLAEIARSAFPQDSVTIASDYGNRARFVRVFRT